MRKFYLWLFFIVIACNAFSQKNGVVLGVAMDTILKQPVPGCTITILERKDSSLVSFTMTGNDGRFEIKGIPDGRYRILLTHTNYHNSSIFFTISDSSRKADLGYLLINDLTIVLAEVILPGEAPPVTLINDTIQYNAGSFKVQPNGSVEQLLKKLPGVKVEKDGTIKAQGEKVTRVLVDGKEFFGDDPKMATKNLPADAIDKVQVFGRTGRTKHVFNLLSGVDSLQDKITPGEIDTAFARLLQQQNTEVPYKIEGTPGSEIQDEGSELTVGIKTPVTYKLNLGNTMPYLIGKIKLPILFSIFLLGITIISFLLLYKNVLRQHRLNLIKNDFISNITHELKTPLATVGVAIEALKNFNAIEDPRRTREYLDITSNELQRLNLLVDKVLKLSMFERKELELKFEDVNLLGLVNEVADSLKLQLDKVHAEIIIDHSGELILKGDRLHLLSIIFNLIDNAIKYSRDSPVIMVNLKGSSHWVELTPSR